jgi:hypothetical protein
VRGSTFAPDKFVRYIVRGIACGNDPEDPDPGGAVTTVAGTLLLIGCAAAPAQDAPIKFGLWEGTARQQTTAEPATVAALKQKGVGVPISFTQSYRKCIDRTQWLKTRAAVAVAPQGCAFVHKVTSNTGMGTSLKCGTPDGTTILIDSDISWEAGVKTHATNRMTTIYPGTIGQVVLERKYESHFVSADCGTVPPGKTVPLN